MARTRSKPSVKLTQSILAVLAATTPLAHRAHATTVTSTWTGASSSAWTTASNWSPTTTYPNNGNAGITDYDALIPAVTTPAVAPVVNSDITIDDLTLNTSASLAIQAGNILQLNGNLSNSGTVTVGSTTDATAATLFLGSTTVSGTGTISLRRKAHAKAQSRQEEKQETTDFMHVTFPAPTGRGEGHGHR